MSKVIANMHSEECAERAYFYAERTNECRAKARSGKDESRRFWRDQAARYERMVGVWMAIANEKRRAAL